MPFNSIGDLANSFLLSQSSALAKQNLQRFSSELTSGLTSDVKGVLVNDMSRQVYWQQNLASNGVLNKTLSEALVRTQAKQAAISSIGEVASSFSNDVSTTVSSHSSTGLKALSTNSAAALGQVISHLNTQVAGRSLFSGATVGAPVMASSEEILNSVKAYIGPFTSSSEFVQGVENWMNDTVNGYSAIAYLGGDQDVSPIRISENRMIDEPVKASDPEIKSIVENLILATLGTDDGYDLTPTNIVTILEKSSSGLRTANGPLIELEANIGFVAGRIQNAKTQVAAEISTLEQVQASVLGIDEFEVASKLQATELQLEKIFTFTARTSQMSLLEYLR